MCGKRGEREGERSIPVISAGANFQDSIQSGKLNGMMAPTTPIGSLLVYKNLSSELSITSPLIFSENPAKYSNDWITIGRSSTWATPNAFPLSNDSIAARIFKSLRMRSANLYSNRPRSLLETCFQTFSNAFSAALTAMSMSFAEASATVVMTLPVEGLMVSNRLPSIDSTNSLLMKSPVLTTCRFMGL